MTETMHTAGVRWQLRELLERHDLTAYRLANELKGKMNAGSVYALARGETERVSLATLGHLLAALESLAGQRYTVADLLEYAPTRDTETLEVLADHPDILERTARLERSESKLIPIEDVAAKYGVSL